MKRIPKIKFPQRNPKPSSSGTPSAVESKGFAQSAQVQTPPPSGAIGNYRFKADVPAAPSNIAVGGKASDLPKRTPLSEKEIEAIMLGGSF